jgi:phage shock protein PspC (stress-responsive transcriptional regulator)
MRRTQRLTRSLIDRVFGGVCGGLGAYIGINPWWVRLAFIALTIFTIGTGLLLYLTLWLAIPEQSLSDLQGMSGNAPRRTSPETLVLIGGGIILVGLLVLAFNLGVLSNTNGGALLPFAIILLGLTLLAQQLRRAAR